MYADECTSNRYRVTYARVLEKMDVTRPPHEVVKVMDPGGHVFDQFVSYEWWPQYCPSCCQLGHMCQEPPPKQPPKPRPENKAPTGDAKKAKQACHHKEGQPQHVQQAGHGKEPVTTQINGNEWHTVRGKSASKNAVVPEEQIVEIENGFVPLSEITFQQVFQVAMHIYNGGQSSGTKGRNVSDPRNPYQ
ncbi:hypothetical protein RND71_002288 [Anisodus tanguticus]|uniref:Uncharacterized protein n=1 Tax=Anisodus tanguticus TaxID=243964 RepID=A0AAE1VWG3_9SOLA|nr:hypothetical protein RND71_002288 [Anisodus tanguticus]